MKIFYLSFLSYIFWMILLFFVLIECHQEKLRQEKIPFLTLEPDQLAIYRLTGGLPQLNYFGGYCEPIKRQSLQCYKRGGVGIEIHWECKTNFTKDSSLDNLNVICEGSVANKQNFNRDNKIKEDNHFTLVIAFIVGILFILYDKYVLPTFEPQFNEQQVIESFDSTESSCSGEYLGNIGELKNKDIHSGYKAKTVTFSNFSQYYHN